MDEHAISRSKSSITGKCDIKNISERLDAGGWITTAEASVIAGLHHETLLEAAHKLSPSVYKIVNSNARRKTYRWNKIGLDRLMSFSPMGSMHAFSTDESWAIIGPCLDLSRDDVVVGSLFDLLTKYDWTDHGAFIEAVEDFHDEQEFDRLKVEEAFHRIELEFVGK